MRNVPHYILFLLISLFASSEAFSDKQKVTLLVAYHPEILEDESHSAIASEVSEQVQTVNEIYDNSEVEMELELVHIESYEIGGDNHEEFVINVQNDTGLKAMRNEHSADFVTYFADENMRGVGVPSGRALGSGSPEGAYNVIRWDRCGSLLTCDNAHTLVHELGHNMGLNHEGIDGTFYAYGQGYRFTGGGGKESFSTIMGPGTEKEYVLSNPDIMCPLDASSYAQSPCGEEGEADAARALNNKKEKLSKFRRELNDPIYIDTNDSDPYVFNAPQSISLSWPPPPPGGNYEEVSRVIIVKDGQNIVDEITYNNSYDFNYTEGSYYFIVRHCEGEYSPFCYNVGQVELEAQPY